VFTPEAIDGLDFSHLTPEQLAEVDDILRRLAEDAQYDWLQNARPEQLMPITEKGWRTMFCRCGRGWGKTRTGAEWVRWLCENNSNLTIVVGAPTKKDIRETIAKAIVNVFPPQTRPKYIESKQRIVNLPNNNLIVCYSAEMPELPRGQNSHYCWLDEIGSYDSNGPTFYMNIRMGLRLGDNPQCLITSTPTPSTLVKQIVSEPNVIVVEGSTFDNAANLAARTLDYLKELYEGTRMGNQELYGQLLLDTPGALWSAELIGVAQIRECVTDHRFIVIGVDPAVTSDAKSDLTGIVVAALGEDELFYVLEDASGVYTPNGWAAKVIELYESYNADFIIAEANNGGDLVINNIKSVDPNANVKKVYATRGKERRAEPVVGLYEQGRVRHVPNLAELEKQLCGWSPYDRTAKSPDRLDALVWAMTYLLSTMRKRLRVF